jgi:hypothetical protein
MADLILQHVVQHEIWWSLGLSAFLAIPEVAKYCLPIVYYPSFAGSKPGLYTAAASSVTSIVGQPVRTVQVSVTTPNTGKPPRTRTITAHHRITTLPQLVTITEVHEKTVTTTKTEKGMTTQTVTIDLATKGVMGTIFSHTLPKWVAWLFWLVVLAMTYAIYRQKRLLNEQKGRAWYEKRVEVCRYEKQMAAEAKVAERTAQEEVVRLHQQLETQARAHEIHLMEKDAQFQQHHEDTRNLMDARSKKFDLLVAMCGALHPEDPIEEDMLDAEHAKLVQKDWETTKDIREGAIRLSSDKRWIQTMEEKEYLQRRTKILEEVIRAARTGPFDASTLLARDETKRLEAVVVELEGVIAEKDRRIAGLEEQGEQSTNEF